LTKSYLKFSYLKYENTFDLVVTVLVFDVEINLGLFATYLRETLKNSKLDMRVVGYAWSLKEIIMKLLCSLQEWK
jgi:hypothetical protein